MQLINVNNNNIRKGGFNLKRVTTKGISKLILSVVLVASVTLMAGFSVSAAKQNSKAIVKHPKVEFLMKNGSTMTFELYPEYAPATVANFIKLANSKFYDGLKFHRIIKGFMVQGGDPLGTGMGGSKDTIKGEFAQNGFTQNTLKHVKGVISMARESNDLNSASSQFFIVDGDNSGPDKGLDGQYAAFGKLIQGEKTLDAIAATPVGIDPSSGEPSKPKKDVVIKKVIVLKDK